MDENTEGQATGTPAGQDSPDTAALQAEVDKWKALSRKNEERFKSLSSEFEDFQKLKESDTQRLVEAAKVEARNAAMTEVGPKLVDAELRAAASAAGVNLPGAEFLNLTSFLGPGGNPDPDRIQAFVSSLPKPQSAPSYAKDIGLGRQGGSTAGQLTREDLARMTPQEINAARKEGKCDALLRGEI